MKAIITNIKKRSAYAKYNGLTFEVKEVLSTLIALQIPDENGKLNTVDFTFKEVMIVDFEQELQRAYCNANWDNKYLRHFNNLKNYQEIKKIQKIHLQYNCPA
jgi:3-deoxy-D-arabino-heptulosonate 7-phosphate (DAHP) synthase class II